MLYESSVSGEGPVTGGYLASPTLGELNRELAQGSHSWRRLGACPVCDSGVVGHFARVRELALSRCRSCGFTFANPIPPAEVRDAFYSSPYYSNYRRLEDARRQEDPYFSISMYTDMRALATLVAARRPETVLDFGCGTAPFIALLRDEFGMEGVEGYEISEEACDRGRQAYGLPLVTSTGGLAHEQYDFVLLLEVIEHVPAPNEFFAEVAELVRPGGHILITTPAVDGLAARRLPRMCSHYTAPSHVSLFTQRSMDTLLARHGFSSVHRQTDVARGAARTAAASLLYSLDFKSPRHDADVNDALFRPTWIGRRLGRIEARRPDIGRLAERAAGYADRVLDRFAERPDHLYVLARRDASA